MKTKFGTNFMVGCRFKETGLFTVQGVDGLLGLSNSDNTLVAKLYDEKKIPDKVFSLCLTPDGGYMRIGAVNTSRHSGEIAYAKLASDSLNTNFFNIKLKDLQIGNASIEAPPATYSRGLFTVDSGTTYTYLPASMRDYFVQAFQQATGLDYELSGDLPQSCNGYSEDQVALFPAIRFVLEAESGEDDLVLELASSQYLIYENERFCGGLFFTEDYGGFIGANVMMHRDVIFDGGNNRIGFADANCTFTTVKRGNDVSTSSSSDSHTGTSSSTADGSSGDRSAGNTGNSDSQFASAAAGSSHTRSFVIGFSFLTLVLVLVAVAFVVRRRRRAGAKKRSHHHGEAYQLEEFDDDYDYNGDYDGDDGESIDSSNGQKESFVTPHFLIHSPPALVARSPRNQQILEDEETDGGDDYECMMMRFNCKARDTRSNSRLQGVEL